MKEYMKNVKCNTPCFGSGSEASDWMAHNCDHCVKASRTFDGINYTKGHCIYQKDILKQWMGSGNDEIREKTYELTREFECPLRQEHNKPKKRRKSDKSLNLFNDEKV